MITTNYTNYSGQATDLNMEHLAPRNSFMSPEKAYFESRESLIGSNFVTSSSTATRSLFAEVDTPRNMPVSLGAGAMFKELVPGFSFPEGLRDRLGGVFRWPVDVEEVLSPYFENDQDIGGPKMMYWTNVSRYDATMAASLLSGSGYRWRVRINVDRISADMVQAHLYRPLFKNMLRVHHLDEEFELTSDKSMSPSFDAECNISEAKIYSEWLKTLASAPHILNGAGNTLSFVKKGNSNITPILCDYYPADVVHENGISPQLELSGACALTYAMNKYPSIEHNLLAINNEGPRVNVTWMWTTQERTLQKQLIAQFNIAQDMDWYRYCVFVSRLPGYLQQEADKYNLAMTTVGQKRTRETQYKAPSTLVVPVVEPPAYTFRWQLTKERPKDIFRPKRRRIDISELY